MKTCSQYDVQKKAEEGGAPPPPRSAPTRPSKACLCTLIVLSVLITLSLAVALTLLLTSSDWLQFGRSGDGKWIETSFRTGSVKSGADSSRDGSLKGKTADENTATVTTTETPPSSLIGVPASKSPTTKFWFKEVIFFKPQPETVDPTAASTIAPEKPTEPSDTSPKEYLSPLTLSIGTKTQTETPAAQAGKEAGEEREIKPVTAEQILGRLWPDVKKMLSDATSKALPYFSMFFPPGGEEKAHQTGGSDGSDQLVSTTPAPNSAGDQPTLSAPTATSAAATEIAPEDQTPPGKSSEETTSQHAADAPGHGARVRRVPNWIFGGGRILGPSAFAHAFGSASSSGGGSLGSGSFVRSFSRSRNGVSRTWTVKDEDRNGVRTHSSSDTGPVRLPEQRTSGRTHLVYDGSSGTWRPAADTSATWTTPALPTMRPWVFRSPAASGAWGAFDSPGASRIRGGDGGDTSTDVFAAARRRLAEATRRMRERQQNLGGFTGFTNWGR